MAELDPATHHARVRERKKIHWRADARQMGGRLEAAHDEIFYL